MFDQLATPAKLALLTEVGWALLRDTSACPKLTAINESAVSILFANIEHSLHIEVDAQKDGYEDSLFWRPLVLAVFREIGDTVNLPDPDCTDRRIWVRLRLFVVERFVRIGDVDVQEKWFRRLLTAAIPCCVER